MKLLVNPIYGWGWFYADGPSLDVPPQFELDALVTEDGVPFTSVLGFLAINDHPLSQHWVLLLPRHKPFDGACNLYAFQEKPIVPKISQPLPMKPNISGFVQAQILTA